MIELLVFKGIKLFLISWVLSSWGENLVSDIDIKKKSHPVVRLLYVLPLYVLSCPKCFTFWFVLGITFNFYWAAGISFLIMLVDKLTQNIKTRL